MFAILKKPSGAEVHRNLENSTCDSLKYKIRNHILIVSIHQKTKGLCFHIGGNSPYRLSK